MNARISFSRSARITNVGVWTRPAVVTLKPPFRELNAVKARVPFNPINQSLSLRQRAASANGNISSLSRMPFQAWKIASSVIDCIHIRLIFRSLVTLAICSRYLKISSPSRPASHAFTTVSISFFFSRRANNLYRGRLFSMGWSSNRGGITGKCFIPHGNFLPFGPSGILSSTRWPTAEDR